MSQPAERIKRVTIGQTFRWEGKHYERGVKGGGKKQRRDQTI